MPLNSPFKSALFGIKFSRMDNLTHTMAGYLLSKSSRVTDPKKALAIIWAAVISSNFPDLDILLSPLSGHSQIGYLLHHRGHTHTVLFTIPIALISALLGALFAWVKPFQNQDRTFTLKLFSITWIASLLHILMDYANPYGVHPFWPWNNSWYYGDFVFIIEPFLWLTLIAFAFHGTKNRFRWIWASLSIGMLIFIWVVDLISLPLAITLTILFILLHFFFSRTQEFKKKLRITYSCITLIYATFLLGSNLTRMAATEKIQDLFPEEKFHDILLQPAPGNPFCWNILTLSTDEDSIWIRKGAYRHFPKMDSLRTCEEDLHSPRVAPMTPLSEEFHTDSIVWGRFFKGELSTFHHLAREHCHFAALLRFARFPYWQRQEGQWLMGDIRYTRTESKGFAEFSIEDGEECPRHLPPWNPPLRDLLDSGETKYPLSP
jgi:inner membrane protein